MAYTFDQINNALGQDQNNANIFGQSVGADGSQGGQSAQSPAGSGAAPKTSTEGDISAGNAGSSGGAAPKPQVTAQTSGQAILDKAKKSNLDTGFASNLVNDVKKGEQTLQNEANAYTSAQNQKSSSNLSAADIEQGLTGNSGKFSQVEDMLRGPQKRADQFQSGVAGQFQDIDQIGTQGGLQSYLKKRGNENYTEGQAALDSLLFSRDKNFQNSVQAAKQERENFNKQKLGLESTLQNQAQAKIDESQNAARQDTKKYIDQARQKFQDEAAARVAAENARRQQIEAGAGNQANEDAWNVFEPLKAQLGAGASPYLEAARKKIDANQYAQHGYTAANTGDVISGQEASRFNSILGLLGQGGSLAANNPAPYQGYSYNKDAYRNALMEAVKQMQSPSAHGSAGGYVPAATGGFNPFSPLEEAKAHPLQTLATGGQNIAAKPLVDKAKPAAEKLKNIAKAKW